MNERISSILHHRATVPTVVGMVAGGTGLTVGFFVGREHMARQLMPVIDDLSRKTDELVELVTVVTPVKVDVEDIYEETRRKIEISKDQLKLPVEETDVDEERLPPPVIIPAETYEEIVDHEDIDPEDQVVGVVVDRDEPPVEVSSESQINVFEGTTPWDQAGEDLKRDRLEDDATYQVSYEEFFADYPDYRQEQLTFYEGDEILVDGDEKPIYNHLVQFPDFNFGYGSNEPNVAYFRNDGRKVDFEITKHSGFYSVEVLGQEVEQELSAKELRHSHAPRRMRREE